MGRGVPQKAFDLLAIGQQPVHHFLGAGFLAQARFILQRLFNRNRLDPFHGNHLRQPVHLPVRHLQHTANVAHRRLGQQCTESDDLPHLVAAVFLLHIADHLFPAIHAEVDIEVGHGDPLGVEKPFKQQRVTKRVQIGNCQRIGHETTRARSPPRPHRNALILAPFDKVGDDQEVAGEPHPLNDIQLKLQPFFIVFHRSRMGDDSQPGFQPVLGLAAQFNDFVICEFRQDRVAAIRLEGTAFGNFNGVFQRLRQISKQCHHFLLRLEVMLRRQPPAWILLIDISPLGNTDKRIMRLVHIRFGEIDVVGRDQRDIHPISHLDKPAFAQLFRLGLPCLTRMTLQFDIEPVGKDTVQPPHQLLSGRTLPSLQQLAHRPLRPAAEADQTI